MSPAPSTQGSVWAHLKVKGSGFLPPGRLTLPCPTPPQGWTALTLWLQAMPGSFSISVLHPLWVPIRDHLFWSLTVLTPAPALHTIPTPHTPHPRCCASIQHPRPHCVPRPGLLCLSEGTLRCWVLEQLCNHGGQARLWMGKPKLQGGPGGEAVSPPPLPGGISADRPLISGRKQGPVTRRGGEYLGLRVKGAWGGGTATGRRGKKKKGEWDLIKLTPSQPGSPLVILRSLGQLLVIGSAG